jgi:hypothetical protein
MRGLAAPHTREAGARSRFYLHILPSSSEVASSAGIIHVSASKTKYDLAEKE